MKENQDTLSVVMPVYNEEEIIETVVMSWYETLESLNVEFVICCYNDGSGDRTGDILNKLAGSLPRLIVINKVNTGHGPTILQGYLDAEKANWILQVDSDNEILADQFERLWSRRDKYDFLLGRRSHANFPLSRQMISFFARHLIKFGFGSAIQDVNSPFRLFRSATVIPLIRLIPTDTFAPNVLMAGLVSAYQLRVKEIDIINGERLTGTVSIKHMRLLRVAIQSFKESLLFCIKHRKKE